MKFYETTWFTVLMLLLFFPIGLFLMWKYQKFNKIARIALSVIFGFLIVGNIFGDSEENQLETTSAIEKETASVEAEDESEKQTAEELAAEQAAIEEKEKADAEAKKKTEQEEADAKIAKQAAEEKKKEEAKKAQMEALATQEVLFDAELGSQVTELGTGLSLIGDLFILLSTDPLAGQSEEFDYASEEIVKMLERLHENANALDAPSTRQEAKAAYIDIIEHTQQAADAGIEGVKSLDSDLINEGGVLMNEVNQMLESFMATHY